MQTLESIKEITAKLKYKDWIFRIEDKTGSTPFLQIQFWDKDFYTEKNGITKLSKMAIILPYG